MSTFEEQESLKELLNTSKNYERLAFLKGIAGLYYRSAIGMLIGLFGLLILESISQGEIFYDKGFFGIATEFTITQVGIIVVFIALIGDICFAFTRFITDQRYTEFLSKDDRQRIVRNFSLGSVIAGLLVAVPTIILAAYDIIGEAQGWAMMGIFLGGMFLLLGKAGSHKPTLFYGAMIILASIFIVFETIPGPYWMIFMMVFGAGGILTAIASYIIAQQQF